MSLTFNDTGRNFFLLEVSTNLSAEQMKAVLREFQNAVDFTRFFEWPTKTNYIVAYLGEDLSRDSFSEITSVINNKLSKIGLTAVVNSSQIYGVTITKINESEKNESKALNDDNEKGVNLGNLKNGFVLHFECENNKIKAETLAKVLIHMNALLTELNSIIGDGSEPVEFYVSAVESGSIKVETWIALAQLGLMVIQLGYTIANSRVDFFDEECTEISETTTTAEEKEFTVGGIKYKYSKEVTKQHIVKCQNSAELKNIAEEMQQELQRGGVNLKLEP